MCLPPALDVGAVIAIRETSAVKSRQSVVLRRWNSVGDNTSYRYPTGPGALNGRPARPVQRPGEARSIRLCVQPTAAHGRPSGDPSVSEDAWPEEGAPGVRRLRPTEDRGGAKSPPTVICATTPRVDRTARAREAARRARTPGRCSSAYAIARTARGSLAGGRERRRASWPCSGSCGCS